MKEYFFDLPINQNANTLQQIYYILNDIIYFTPKFKLTPENLLDAGFNNNTKTHREVLTDEDKMRKFISYMTDNSTQDEDGKGGKKKKDVLKGAYFDDKDGTRRHEIRVRWWGNGKTYKDVYMGPESAITGIPDDLIESDHMVEYGHDEKPVFLGHYWMEGEPAPLASNIACVDYSVAKLGGKLVAYRWFGEQSIHSENYVWCDRMETSIA
mgnify:CR=1 FL=1